MQRPAPLLVFGCIGCLSVLAMVCVMIWNQIDPPSLPPLPTPPPDSIAETIKKIVPELELTDEQWGRLADEHGNTAVNVAKEYGKNGVLALLNLGTPAVAVMREDPKMFAEIAKRLNGPTAAAFLVMFAPHLKNLIETGMLINFLDRVEALPVEAKELGKSYPQMLLFLVLAPDEVLPTLQDRDTRELCLSCYPPIDLRHGPKSLITVARAIEKHGVDAKQWVLDRGLDGILLADKFPQFIGKTPSGLTLPTFLQILSQNQDDIALLIQQGRLTAVKKAFDLLAKESMSLPKFRKGRRPPFQGDWLKLACEDAHTIRFIVDTGLDGFSVLEGLAKELVISDEIFPIVMVPSVLYDGYAHTQDLPVLWRHAWESLRREKGSLLVQNWQTLNLMFWQEGSLQQDAHPRVNHFRILLQKLDHRVVIYLYQAECDPKSVEGRYKTLEQRGKDALDAMQNLGNPLAEALPGYDAQRLAVVLSKGYPPTFGEVGFGVLDATLTAFDLATLIFGKPPVGGVVKSGIKTALRESAEALAKKIFKDAGKMTDKLFAATIGRMLRSPKFVEEAARKGLANQLATAIEWAQKSAASRQILLRLTTYIVKEWSINSGVGKGLEVLVKQIPADSYWGGKAVEALEALKSLDKPIQ